MGVLMVLALGLTGYIMLDNNRIVVKRQNVLIHELPDALEGYTILHISDLNAKRFGARQKGIADALANVYYDAVCLTGDMVGESGDMYPFHELLSVLDIAKPIFFIAGDSDPSPVSQQRDSFATLSDWVSGAQARGATYLDVPAQVKANGKTIWFTDAVQLSLDLDLAAAAYQASGKTNADYYADVVRRTIAVREAMEEDDLHITLSHNPMSLEAVGRLTSGAGDAAFIRTVDLVLSGGTVGGQWRLPLIGSLWADGFFPGNDGVFGFRRTGIFLEYISGGLSTSGRAPLPPFRLFNTPEVTVIKLTAVMGEDVLPD